MIFDIENWLESQILALFDNSPLNQNSKFNNFLWACWFLGKHHSNFESPVWKLHNPYCYIFHIGTPILPEINFKSSESLWVFHPNVYLSGCLLFLNKPKTLFFFFQLSGQRHRCFVCAPNTRKYADFQELKKMFGDTKIPKCSHYHNSRRHDFIQECPKDSKGCLTQFEGDNTL